MGFYIPGILLLELLIVWGGVELWLWYRTMPEKEVKTKRRKFEHTFWQSVLISYSQILINIIYFVDCRKPTDVDQRFLWRAGAFFNPTIEHS